MTDSRIAATPRLELSHGDIFNGVSFRLSTPSQGNVDKILDMSQVKAIYPVRTYARPSAAIRRSVKRDLVAELIETKRATSNDIFPPHVMGRVNELHAEGFTGAGVKIAVVDTGIDYRHPSLGGSGVGTKFPTKKVAFGYDLVGTDYTGANIPVPDADPLDCDGHGTHVAGTIGAIDEKFTGVAPEATLGIYKVFGCPPGKGGAGSAGNDVLIKAFADAHAEGVDIITASIGGVSGWSEDPWAVAVERIVKAGTPCTIAAGNDGAEGLFYASGAADGVGAIAVGSVNNLDSPGVLTTASYVVDSTNATFGYTPAIGDFGSQILPVYPVNPTQACTPITDNVDLSDKLVLIQRGVCTFDTKVNNALAKGAKNIMLYNNAPGASKASVTVLGVNVGMVTPETGATWITAFKAGKTVTVAFKPNAPLYITTSPNPVNGGFMSIFSSWSPTYELVGRPHVSGPGGNILSTYLLDEGGYAVLSGTSMATPYIAGVVGLYTQSLKKLGKTVDALNLRNILASCGRPLKFSDGTATPYEYYAPAIQQGSGLVDAYAVIHNTVSANVENLNFNDTQNFHASLDFKLTNFGTEETTFSLSHLGAATAYFTESGKKTAKAFPPDMITDTAAITIEPNTVTIRPGASKRIVVRAVPPKGADASRVPVYSGWVQVTSADNSTNVLSIPYTGIYAKMKDIAVTLNINDNSVPAEESFPQLGLGNGTVSLSTSLVLGTARLLVDVVAVSNATLNTLTTFSDKVYGAFNGFPLEYQPRNKVGETYD